MLRFIDSGVPPPSSPVKQIYTKNSKKHKNIKKLKKLGNSAATLPDRDIY